MLARRKSELQLLRHDVHSWHGSSLTDPTDGIARMKAVPVPCLWFESAQFDVNRVSQLRCGQFCTRLNNLPESFVDRDFPLHFVAFRSHPTAIQRIDGDTRPEYYAITGWVAGSDTQLKRILRK